ncbi:PREDICTED: putative pentatricopeptide repeat-containing protein At5g08310, mitochondrial [Nelumbo nucifera]|uniref:Pentatricopeptide repeat-containing protein At5g08310, mitochondrial n=1 Tax=Nelumbo nucifera TaxID=4432 RepID=A0A1U7ZCT0_NELNU|nr:PREDICTED: putative pentatricopeptide repeat-containing protein At5g08310, mitochondrial [Nelumbo nucifera]XP_010251397.1 PREDICTED: putative pentatricopeptide repeat-containing protein At5g08310, mitochondrial [Nelumbo nucifera]
MASKLGRTINTSKLFPPKTLNPCHLIPSFVHKKKISINEHSPFFPESNIYTEFSRPYHSSEDAVSIHSDSTTVVEELTAIFTNQPLLRTSEELTTLGTKLNTETVESVLKGLKSWRIAYEFFSWAADQDGYRHNCYTYNAMASILSRAKQTAKLKILARDMVNSRCPMTPGALGFLIRCLGSQGLVDEANYIFDQVKMMGLCFPNSYTYNCLLEALSKSTSVDLVEKRLREMQNSGFGPDKFTLTPVLRVYCNAGKFEKVLDVFNQIRDRGWIDGHIFTILMISFSKWGEVDKAMELIERMEDLNISLNEKTLCVLIHGFVRESRVEKALHLFDKMRKLGFKPDLPLYDVLIRGLCQKKELRKALNLYMEMKDSGILPDVSIISKLISSLCGEGDLASTKILLEEGEQALDAKALILLYNTLLDGLVNHGLVDKAYLLLRVMMGAESVSEAVNDLVSIKKIVSPDCTSFSIVIDGFCNMGQLDSALRLFWDMIRMGWKGNVLLYNNLINELCNANRVDEGFELLKEMKKSGFKPTQFTHNSIFGCFCRREDVSRAIDLVREMRENGHEPWIKYYSLLVKQLCIHGKVIEASDFLNNMVQEGFLPEIIAYSIVMDGFFKIQGVDKATKLFRDICGRGYCPDVIAYNILMNGLCKARRVSEAQDVLNEMLEKGVVPSVVTYNILIDGWCKTHEIDQAILCLSKMVEKAREPTVVTYSTLIDGLCNAGRPNDALILWNEMVKKGCSPNKIAYTALIHGLIKCNKADIAVVFFHEMKEKEMKPDRFVYLALINDFVSKGNSVLALEVLKDMVTNEKFPSPLDKDYPLCISALHKLSEDVVTSSDVKNLIVQGLIPTIGNVSDMDVKSVVEPRD